MEGIGHILTFAWSDKENHNNKKSIRTAGLQAEI